MPKLLIVLFSFTGFGTAVNLLERSETDAILKRLEGNRFTYIGKIFLLEKENNSIIYFAT